MPENTNESVTITRWVVVGAVIVLCTCIGVGAWGCQRDMEFNLQMASRGYTRVQSGTWIKASPAEAGKQP